MSSCFLALWQYVCRGPSGEQNVVGDGVGQLAGRQQQQPLPRRRVVGRGEEGSGDAGAVPGLLAVATHQFPAKILYRRGLV